MRRLLLTTIGLLMVILAFGQQEFTNSRGAQHRQVKGTKFFLIPPEGFVNASSFQGFQQPEGASSILVMHLPGPFSEVSRGLTAEGLQTQGILLQEKSEVRVNGLPGFYLTAEQSAYGIYFSKYMLVYGDEKTSYMVTGMHPQELTEMGKGIENALLSVVYAENAETDPLGAVSFQVDTENTKLKFAKLMTGVVTYTVDGKIPTESNDKTSYMVAQSFSPVATADKKRYTLHRLKNMPYHDFTIEENNIRPVIIDGLSGYEIEAEGVAEDDGKREVLYHVMIYTGNGYYLMLGSAKDDFDQNLALFKQVTRTFRRR